jgi:hypothetical protein
VSMRRRRPDVDWMAVVAILLVLAVWAIVTFGWDW